MHFNKNVFRNSFSPFIDSTSSISTREHKPSKYHPDSEPCEVYYCELHNYFTSLSQSLPAYILLIRVNSRHIIIRTPVEFKQVSHNLGHGVSSAVNIAETACVENFMCPYALAVLQVQSPI